MSKLSIIALSLLIAVGTFSAGIGTAFAVDYTYCPGAAGLNGWWASFTPSNRLCTTSYWTYNTVSLATEESWYFSSPTYVLCNKPTPPTGPTYYDNLGSRVYIPSPHSTQTHAAHYYRWQNSSNWNLLGTVDQYNTFGWATLAATTWSYVDQFKMSDWTGESLYSKTTDLDAFKITNCPA